MEDVELVIMAGGGGTRLFPLSRDENPKQFVKFFGKYSLFQETVRRFDGLYDGLYVVTLEKYRSIVESQLHELGARAEILVEPVRRNTLGAVALAAFSLDEPFLITPADHMMIIGDEKWKFEYGVEHSSDRIILFGIKPRGPSTHYGYIQPGDSVDGVVLDVVKFHEKPDEVTAREYIELGFLWNSGIFAISPSHFRRELKRLQPRVYEALKVFVDGDVEAYYSLPDLSVDVGFVERTDKRGVIPVDVKWSDLGTFASIYDFFEKDENGNVVFGGAVVDGARNSLVICDAPTFVGRVEGGVVVNYGGVCYVGRLDDSITPKRFSNL